MASNDLTMSELLLELGVSPSTNSTLDSPSDSNSTTNTKSKKSRKDSFLTKQFVLFSTSHFVIYLQGVLPEVAAAFSPEAQILAAFKNSKARKLGKRESSTEINQLVDYVITSRRELYTNKEFHFQLLNSLLKAGFQISKDKVANKALVIHSIEGYLGALVEFLIEEGYPTPEAYLESKTIIEKSELLTTATLQNIWDSL